MSNDTVIEAPNPAEGTRDDLTDLLREGAKRLIAEAVDAELSAMLTQFEDYKDQSGRRHVVRNGYLPERDSLTGIGPVSVRVPKVRVRWTPSFGQESGPVKLQSSIPFRR